MGPALDRVRERDLDVLLASHLSASDALRALVLGRALQGASGQGAGPHTLLDCRVSVASDLGETDLLLVVRLGTEGGRRLALMLEHKIDAPFQPNQAARYRRRGEQGVRDGGWDEYRTFLVAPASYLAAVPEGDGWDGRLALQEIAAWARAAGGPHEGFFARTCDGAVAQRAAATSEASPEATAFWRAYREAAAKLLPELTVTGLPAVVGRASPWPNFGAGSLPHGVVVQHKPQQGRVDLSVSNQSVERLKAVTHGRLPKDVVVEPAGRSAALRLAVPSLDHLLPFAEQQAEVLAALAAAERLHGIGRLLPGEALG